MRFNRVELGIVLFVLNCDRAFLLAQPPAAGGSTTAEQTTSPAPKWRIDASGSYVCPPLDPTIPLAQALREKLHASFDTQARYVGAHRGEWPDGPCHSPEDAAKIDALPLPVCPSVDRSLSERDALNLSEPYMRISRNVQGHYQGVMHDTPSGPCRPRRPEEESLPTEPRCNVMAVGELVSKDRVPTIKGASVVDTVDGLYLGAMIPVSCAIHDAALDLMKTLNENALAAQRARRDAQLARLASELEELRHRELVEAIRSLAKPLQTKPIAVEDVRQQKRLDAGLRTLERIGFSLDEINQALQQLKLQRLVK